FGRLYNLPVPFWMYAYGAAAALLLSFLLVAWFATADTHTRTLAHRDVSHTAWLQTLRRGRILALLKIISVLGLLLCVLTGLFGNRNPYVNFSMTFFWIVFVLGFSYLTALTGDLYATINPWRVISEILERGFKNFSHGRLRYPQALGYWPALAFYMAFIWIELFAFTRPFSLAMMLLAYSVINLFGVWLIGKTDWFRYCEFFAVFLRLIAKMAPLDYTPSATPGRPGRLRLRAPFIGLLETRAESLSLLVFLLFMLSSTAFDGLRATAPWFKLFWADPFNLITPLVGSQPLYAYVTLRSFYLGFETLCLLLSPFLYLAVYLIFIALAKLITRSPRPLMELALCFGLSLLPIALVYNITHYYTLILTQGVTVLSLLSDPFGWGWNLFGTAGKFRAPILPDMGLVWHSQVGLILFGHIASVYLAHVEALRLFPTRRAALLSQLPMLLLMVIFTTVGLWILAQPIQAGR
ncbi:MAG: hypothetical protein ACRESW_06770, partial [Nevskiales bacterium]